MTDRQNGNPPSLSDGLGTLYTWDAKGRLVAAGGATYTYDALGERVSKSGVGLAWTPDTVYFGGQPIARYAGGQWTDLIYGPTVNNQNGLLAEVPGTQTGAPVYRVTDHLGSTVGSLLADGSFVNPMDYTPFGQVFNGSTSDHYKFTGYERDAESGLDYASARQYGSNIGRFISPDPSGLVYADQTNPQGFNLYAYVRNNPLIFRDPTGLECVWDDGSYDSNNDSSTSDGATDQSGSHTGCSGQGGTWVDHSYFADNNMADWSSAANQTLGDMVDPSTTVTAPDDWSLFDAVSNTLGTVQQNGFYLNGISNFSTKDVFHWAATGNHTPNGCASGLLGCLYHYGHWCGTRGSGAPTDATDSACLVHDFLYAQYKFTQGSNFHGYNPALQEINQGLCNRAGNANILAYFGPIVSGGNLLFVNGPGNPSCK